MGAFLAAISGATHGLKPFSISGGSMVASRRDLSRSSYEPLRAIEAGSVAERAWDN